MSSVSESVSQLEPGFDPGLPELHGRDPRLCPGRPDYAETVALFADEPEPPSWLGPAPWSGAHDWGGPFAPYRECRWCDVSKELVRDRFRDWRYERLVEFLIRRDAGEPRP